MEKHCSYCNTNFKVSDGREFSNHVRWCKKNPRYLEIQKSFSKNLEKRISAQKQRHKEKYEKCPKKCKFCSGPIKYEKRRYRDYCDSTICLDESKKRPNAACKEYRKTQKSCLNCLKCGIVVLVKLSTAHVICQNCKNLRKSEKEERQKQRKLLRKNPLEQLATYRRACAFRFSLNQFSNEFNFSLIEIHGWYSPSNKKNNLTGVSRDHMVSVKYGFENQIDPKIISHPANCRLILHKENSSKNDGCCITLEELKRKIVLWEEKYGANSDSVNTSGLHPEDRS